MNVFLENYITLKEDPRVSKYDDAFLRSLEERLLGNPDEKQTIAELIDRQEKLLKAYRSECGLDECLFVMGKTVRNEYRLFGCYLLHYREVIRERSVVKGRTAKWLKIIKVGNDDFREVYQTVWRKTIIVAERKGIEEYRQSVAKLRSTLPKRDVKQAYKEFMPLYQEAAYAKPEFDKAMLKLAVRFEEKTGMELDLNICPRLKQVPRIIEKSLLKSKVEGDVSGIKDIVRFLRNANPSFGCSHIYVPNCVSFHIVYTCLLYTSPSPRD